MAEGFEAEVLAALRELREGQERLRGEVADLREGQAAIRGEVADLREGQHRVEHALALMREDLGARIDRLRDDLTVTTTIASSVEGRVDETRAIVRELVKGQQELRRRVEKLEDRGQGPGQAS